MMLSSPFLLSEHGSTRATFYHMTNKSVRIGERTHVTWLDAVSRVCVRTYDHTSGQWADTTVIDEGCDNHTNPSISATADGFLRIAYGPHGFWNPRDGEGPWRNGQFAVRQSSRPNDATQWETLPSVGYGATYASLMTDAQGNDHLLYRGASSPPGCVYERRGPFHTWDILHKLSFQDVAPAYTFVGANLHISNEGVLHASFEYFSAEHQASRGLGLLVSRDCGHTWRTIEDESTTLPVGVKSCVTVPAPPNPTGGGMTTDDNGNLWLFSCSRDTVGPAVLRCWDGRGWHTTDLDAAMPGRTIHQGTVARHPDGRLLLAVAAAQTEALESAGKWWGHPSLECYLMTSTDDGETFEIEQISSGNHEVACWSPNIMRNGPNHDLRKPLIIYTEGPPGDGCIPSVTSKVWGVWVEV